MTISNQVRDDDDLPKFVCSECWAKTVDFHKMYKRALDNRCDFLTNSIKMFPPPASAVKCDSLHIDDGDISSMKLVPTATIVKEEIADDIIMQKCSDSINGSCSDAVSTARRTNDTSKLRPRNAKTAKTNERHPKFDHVELTKRIAWFPSSDLSCDFCETIFDSFGEAKRHYKAQHGTPNGYIKCCNRHLITRADVVEHIEWHMNPDAFKCQECSKTVESKSQLRAHILVHVPEKDRKFKCEQCDKRFVRKHKLLSHVEVVHSHLQKAFECDICKSKYVWEHDLSSQNIVFEHRIISTIESDPIVLSRLKSFGALKAHIYRIHLRIWEQICDECGKRFCSKNTLRRHKLSHNSYSLQCTLCSSVFKSEHHLKIHTSRVHGSRPVSCPHCQKISPNQDALAVHVKTMHNYKIHKCHICDRELKSARSLKVKSDQLEAQSNGFNFRFRIAGAFDHAHRTLSAQVYVLPERVPLEIEYVPTPPVNASSEMEWREESQKKDMKTIWHKYNIYWIMLNYINVIGIN